MVGTVLKNYKEIAKSNILIFIVLTFFLTKVFNNVADKWLTYLLNIENETIFTYNYSLGIFGVIFTIPSAIFSIWIIKIGLKFIERFLPPERLNKLKIASRWCFRLLLKLFKVLKNVSIYAVYIFMMIVIYFVEQGMSSGGYSSGTRTANRYSSNSNSRENLKKSTEWQARLKQKEADHAWNYAAKQAKHNINTYHFDNRLHRANAIQREANEAKKRAENL